MTEKLRNHIEGLFEDAPKTRRASDLKEELLANLIERYNDLTENGMSEEEAYKNVIINIGDVNELINSLKETEVLNITETDESRKKTAKVLSISVGLYFLAFIAMIASPFTPIGPIAGFILMIAIAIVPTCMLVYHYASRPKYQRNDNSIVEEFKEWNYDSKHNKSIRGAISATLWTLLTLIYLLVSFLTFAWYITWIIFIVGACIESIISLLFSMNRYKNK